jgi:hypothetical protein
MEGTTAIATNVIYNKTYLVKMHPTNVLYNV